MYELSSYLFFFFSTGRLHLRDSQPRKTKNCVERNIPRKSRDVKCMQNTVSYLNISAINLKSSNSEKDH